MPIVINIRAFRCKLVEVLWGIEVRVQGDEQLASRLEVTRGSNTGGGIVTTVNTGDGTSGNVGGVVGRDSANVTLTAVRTRNSGGGRDGALVRVVTDMRSMAIVGKSLLLDNSGVGTDSSVTRVGSVVRRTNSLASNRGGGNDTLLDVILSRNISGLSNEETASGSAARSVVVGGAGTVSLLLLVVAHKSELHQSSEQEENSSGNGKREDSLVELASSAEVRSEVVAALSVGDCVVGRAVTKRSSDIVLAAVGALAGQDSNSNHATHAEKVDDQTKNGKEGDTSQAAGQKNGADSVQCHDTGETFDGLPSCGDVEVVVCKDGKEVTEDADDGTSAAETEEIESGLQQTEGASLEDTHDD